MTESRLHAAKIIIPEEPLVVLESNRKLISLNLADFWNYRDLLYILVQRDVKVRYKQTVLGILWAVIQPFFSMLIFTLFFGNLAQIPSDGIPYPIFAYAGLLPWTFFANSVTNSGNSIIENSSLITKVFFPRMIIPTAAVAAGIVDFLIASVLFIGLMFYYDIKLTAHLLMLPVLFILTALLSVGFGMWTSAVNVKYRDIRYALPFAVQLLLFATPVIYPSSIVTEKWRWVLLINPLAGQIEGFRSAIFGLPFDWKTLGTSALLTMLILFYAAYNFRRMEKNFADVI